MKIGKVIDNVWSTKKDESLIGHKFLIVQLMDKSKEFNGQVIVAADLIGAGIGEKVLVTQGSPAKYLPNMKNTPIDAVIVGIIDEEVER
ncbi:Carbon dioxide concentrating mechanism protein CcmL [Moorella humiferrea]|uniref:EutN/CcmL family microcompartment protein n=1 Tax=Neomoorella humiferrea TaxID=676965 RepID=UPI0030CCED72